MQIARARRCTDRRGAKAFLHGGSHASRGLRSGGFPLPFASLPRRQRLPHFHCDAQVYREEGAKAFLRGWEPRVTWIAVGGSIFFGSLELCKKVLVPVDESGTKAALVGGH
jgi:Mitochondrial carrier protein